MAGTTRLSPIDADDYLQQFCKWLRSKERRIANSSPQALLRRKTSQRWLTASWTAASDPLLLKLSLHHLDVLLVKLEQYGLDKRSLGPIDIPMDFQPARPTSVAFLDGLDTGEPQHQHGSAASSNKTKPFSKGFDAMSMLSWMSSTSTSATAPTPASSTADARYCFSAFTKIPSLQLSLHDQHFGLVKDFETLPDTAYVPLDLFKNLQLLKLVDLDPRVLFGWDKLAYSLKVLEVTGGDLDDLHDLFVDRVTRDARQRTREFSQHEQQQRDDGSLDRDEEAMQALQSGAWAGLRRLSLSSNALTFAPGEELWQHFSNLVHLDLSNNLLVQIPEGLSALVSLRTLNLSNNMIEYLTGVSTKLGFVQSLDLSRNRIHSLAGLERIKGLHSIDLRHNNIDEAAEVARLAPLPELSLILAGEGNMLANLHARLPWRIELFVAFAREHNDSVLVDGTRPTWMESRAVAAELLKNPATSKRSVVRSSAEGRTSFDSAGRAQRNTTDAGETTISAPTRPPPPPAAVVETSDASAHSDMPPLPSATSHTTQAPSAERPLSPQLSPTKAKHKKRRKPAGRVVDLEGAASKPFEGLSAASPEPTAAVGPSSIATHQQLGKSPFNNHDTSDLSQTTTSPDQEAYRQRIELLRAEVGDDWLRVLGQQKR